jgi:hypothetical protein
VLLVLATHHFADFGGAETYLQTVAGQLQRQGHQVWIHAVEHGRLGDVAREEGLRVAREVDELPPACDALLVQDSAVAYELAGLYPGVPQVFVCHGETFDLNTPPQLPGITAALVVLHDRVGRWACGLADRHEVVRLRQPIDLERFAPRGVIRERPRRLLMLGNYARGYRREMVEAVCGELGIETRVVGAVTQRTERPEVEINDADIVVGKARVILEAMACGRATYVWDHNGGDGWVTPERYPQLEADNFGGQSEAVAIDPERLRRDLLAYRPEMGFANRDLAVANHSHVRHASELAALLTRVADEKKGTEPFLEKKGTDPFLAAGPVEELARMARVQWQSEKRAAGLGREIEALRARLEVVEWDREQLRVRLEAALEREARVEQWAEDVAGRLDYARAIEAEVAALRTTRRFRLAAALARPLDRVRATSRLPSTRDGQRAGRNGGGP